VARRKGYYRGCNTIILPGSNWFGRSEPAKWKKPRRKKKTKVQPAKQLSPKATQFLEEEAWKAAIAAGSNARKVQRANRSIAELRAAAATIKQRNDAKMANVIVKRKRLPPKDPKRSDDHSGASDADAVIDT